MGNVIVCKDCGAVLGNDHRNSIEITAEEHRTWMASGRRPGVLGIDGMGDRDCTPSQSRVEVAYRRGVTQALLWVRQNSATPAEIDIAAALALEMRYDGKRHGAFLDELWQRVRGSVRP